MAKSASDYLAEAQALSQPKAAPKAATGKKYTPIQFTKTTRDSKPQSPLNWLMDIITRPLSGVTNAISSSINGSVDAQKAFQKGDIGEGFKQIAIGANVPGNFLTGLFSDDPAQHRTFSQVIEQGTDKIGSLDPNYVDEQDNVNPVLKGIAGFVGDVALDPLTYVPGGLILKGAKGALEVGKGVVGGATTASKAILAAGKGAKVAEKAAEDATKLPVPTVATAEASGVAKMADATVDEAQALKERIAAAPSAQTPEELLAKSKLATDAALSSEKAKTIKSTLESFKPQTIKVRPETAASTAKAVSESAPKLFDRNWLAEAEDALGDLKVSEAPKVFHQGKQVPMPALLVAASKGDKEALVSLKNWHQDKYMPAFQDGKLNGHGVDVLGRKIDKADEANAGAISELEIDAQDAATHLDNMQNDPEYASNVLANALRQHAATSSPDPIPTLDGLIKDASDEAAVAADRVRVSNGEASSAVHTILTARGSFIEQLATKRAELEQRLGPKLVTSLLRNGKDVGQDTRFDNVLSELKGILDRSINLHDIEKIMPASDRMLKELGIDFGSLPKELRVAQDVPNPGPAPKKMSEALSMMGVGLDTEVAKAAEKGLASFVKKDIIDVRDETIYAHETKTGVKVTTPAEQRGKGIGNIPNELNGFKQYNILNPIMEHFAGVAKRLGDANPKARLIGRARARFMRENVMESWRIAERALDQQGLPFVMGTGTLKPIPLSGSQAVDILTEIDPKGMDAYLWNVGTAVAPTNLFDAVAIATRGGTADEIEAAIRQTSTYWRKKPIPNKIVDPTIIEKNGRRYSLGPEVYSGDELVGGLRDALLAAAPKFRAAAEQNAAAFEKRGLAEATKMLDTTLNELEGAFTEGRVGDLLKGINDTTSRVLDLGKTMGATDLGKGISVVTADALIPDIDKAIAKGAVQGEKIATKASKEKLASVGGKGGKSAASVAEDIQREGVKNAQDTFDAVVSETKKFDPSGNTMDLGDQALATVNAGLFRKAHAIISRKIQMPDIHEAVVANENLWRDTVGEVTDRLNALSRQLPREQFVEAFRALQKGFQPTDPNILKAMPEIDDIVSQMFGRADSNSLMDAAFFRNNASMSHINKAFERYGLADYVFNAEEAAAAAKANGTGLMQEAAKQWRDWDVKDPAEFMNKAYTALMKVNTDQSIAQSWFKFAVDLKAVSTTPRPGYSRITNDSGKSIFAKYLPDNLYFDDNALEQLHAADVLTQQSLDMKGDLGRFINTVYKPVQDIWKTGMTIWNPTHHIRNMISDATLTYLAEGWTPIAAYRKAVHVMGARNSYSNWDAIKAIQGMGEIPDAGRVISSGRLGSKDVSITADGLYSALASRGNLPKFRILESLDEGIDDSVAGSSKLQRSWQKFGSKKVPKLVGGVTEARDHYARVAHAIQIIDKELSKKKSQFKSMDELLDYASARVRKWHPDGSDLTRTEQGFKLLIPFYSWQRKTIPLIAESLLTHPARVTSIPKASYNLAVAMGVNPDTLADPFPDDQMFPSYLTNQITGPQFKINGKYYSINPGFAANDILNDYLGGEPGRTILGSVSPLIRAPFELAAGGQVGTGARINDTSDYLDSQIPGVAPLSRISGNSVTGSLVSMLTGKGLDPQYQIAAGNKDQGTSTALALANWLTGSGITPMSQQNQINYAEIEKRDREGGKTSGF